MKPVCHVIVLAVVLVSPLVAAAELPMLEPADYLEQVTVGTPEVSPNGKLVAYSVSHYCPESEKNSKFRY